MVKDHEGSDDVMVTYGDFSSGNFFAPNCAIVLGIRISPQFEEDTEDNPNWLEQYCEREDLVSIIINRVEEETLTSYPITIQAESIDVSSMMEAMMGISGENDD